MPPVTTPLTPAERRIHLSERRNLFVASFHSAATLDAQVHALAEAEADDIQAISDLHDLTAETRDEATGAKAAAKSALLAVRVHEQRSQRRYEQAMARIDELEAALLVELGKVARTHAAHEQRLTLRSVAVEGGRVVLGGGGGVSLLAGIYQLGKWLGWW